MPTDWTPFPTYSLVYSPSVGAALNTLKSRYVAGVDYYQEAAHEPPFMSDALIADFQKVYDDCLQPLVDMYNKECSDRGRLNLSDHFAKEHYALGTPAVILKVSAAARQMYQLVHFESWVHGMVRSIQQQREQKEQLIKQAWNVQRERFANSPWLEPGNRDIISFMATRIQSLEEQVAKLLAERTNN